MSPKLEELLMRWEEGQRNGHPVSADSLCRDCPDLREDLLVQIVALEKMNQVLDLSEKRPSAERRQTRYDALCAGWEPITGYQLERKLGQGGYGEVWKAIGPGGFAVALKFVPLSSQLGASELRSLEVVKTLRHPNLLAVFGAWQAHGFLIVAMELADRTLLDRLNEAIEKDEIGIPHDELIKYMEEAAKGIDYLNQSDGRLGDSTKEAIQHRDIKPQNIFLMGGGVKIGDFGLLRILKKTVTEHTGSLTLSYAAPEFFQGHTSRWSDQYSLAVTYCQLRGGRLPFAGQPGEIMQGHIQGKPDLTMLPESERPIAMRALAKKPEERWPTCSAFVEALRQSATQTTGQRPLSWRVPRLLILAGCAALIIMCVTIMASYSWLGRSQPIDPITQGTVDAPGPQKMDSSKGLQDKEMSDAASKKETNPPALKSIVKDGLSPPKNTTPAADDLKRLSGTWFTKSRTVNGKKVLFPYAKLRISPDEMVFSNINPKRESKWNFVIDATKGPRTIDRSSGPQVILGIYKLDGNVLTYAFSGPNGRPTDFNEANMTVDVYVRR